MESKEKDLKGIILAGPVQHADGRLLKNIVRLADIRLSARHAWSSLAYLAGTVLFISLISLLLPRMQELSLSMVSLPEQGIVTYPDPTEMKKVEKSIMAMEKKLNEKVPKKPFIIINTTGNSFLILTRNDTLRAGKCSTGSYVILKKGEEQQWVFSTPRGVFPVRDKKASPVWKKPDWAFIEEGLPVPPPNHPSRFEYGVLGDYSLNIGNGYLIHGTLYKRLLGLPVTHGCIRMNDEDLEFTYKKLDQGSRVFIY